MTDTKALADAKQYCHLHCHSHYSFLDGGVRVQKLVQRAADLGMPALALSDHGNMCGAMDLYLAAKELGDSNGQWKVKPIIGTEAYITDDLKKRGGKSFHLLLLAADEQGYKNLVKLNSISHRDGFYNRPRIDFDTLAAHNAGLICTSACLAGELDGACLAGTTTDAERIIGRYREVFDDRYYLEFQNHGIEEQLRANDIKLQLAQRLRVPFICTNDSHYLDRADSDAHDCLLCISTGALRRETNRMKFDNDQFYFKTAEEMAETFTGPLREGLWRTKEIADRCDVKLKFGEYFLPKFPSVPAGMTDDDYIRHLAEKGCEARYGKLSDAIRDRLNFELGVISQMGFPSYFLIVQDFINWAKQQDIPVGPGRGSAAGSIVAYALGITDVDPLKYDLLFERFLNPSRISMPDIDIDFCPEGREAVINYVREKYGEDCVCQIITFAQLKAKAVVRDVGRVLEMPLDEVNRIAKMIPEAPKMSLKKAFEEEPKLREVEAQSYRHRELFEVARRLEGLVRHTGIHAAGVIIAPGPLENYVPLFRQRKEGSDGEAVMTTQFAMEHCESIGLLKMDFLGLRNLTIIRRCEQLVAQSRRLEIDWNAIPDNDGKTYDMLQRGDAMGVFQLESDGMRKLLTQLKPDCFADLIALLAMYRPGPLEAGMVSTYVDVKHGRQPIASLHPHIDDVLAESNGVILYQEQVMRIANKLGGFSLAEADNLRKAMGKKKADLMAQFRDKFVAGAEAQGFEGKKAGEIFDLMAFFAGYGFNKCVTGDAVIVDADTGERTTVGELYRDGRPFRIHALGEDWKLHPRRVTDVMHNGRKPVFTVRTAQGRQLTATANHPFRTLDGWAHLADLQVGDRIAMARQLPTTTTRSIPDHELIALGGLLSEGNVCHPTCLYFFNNNQAAIDDFVAAVETFPETAARIDHRDSNQMEVCVSTGRDTRFQATSDVFWDRIVAIEPQGMQETYDLTVEHDHNFVANGFVVHNSHSTAYAFITYQTAYLKANFPVEYQAALLTCEMGVHDKLAQYLDDTRQMGVDVRGPDVCVGDAGFSVAPIDPTRATASINGANAATGNGNGAAKTAPTTGPDREILFGLGGIKGVGVGVINALVAERAANGPYKSLLDFAERVDPKIANNRVLEALVRAGAFDLLARMSFAAEESPEDSAVFAKRIRPRLLAGLETLRSIGAQKAAERRSGQMSLFGAATATAVDERVQLEKLLPEAPSWSDQELLAAEKETLGFYFTTHPLARHADTFAEFATHDGISVTQIEPGSKVLIGGVVGSFRDVMTKKGRAMAVFELEDMRGKVSCVCFPDAWEANHDNMPRDMQPMVVFVQGRTDRRDGEENVQVIAEKIISVDAVREQLTQMVTLRLRAEIVSDPLIAELRRIFSINRGDVPVRIAVSSELGRVLLNTGPRWRITPSTHFHAAVAELLGPHAISFHIQRH